MNTHHLLPAAVLAAALALAPSRASAFVYEIIDDHTDIGAAFHDGEFHMHWHLHDLELEYEPEEAYVSIDAADFAARPAGPAWDFIGVASGAPVWYAPQSSIPGRPFVGLGAEEIAPGDFDGDTVTFRLTGLTGPGEFSLWQETFGVPTAFLTSADGIGAGDTYVMGAGGHEHFNWGFTSLGVYVLSLEVEGLQGGVPVTASGDFTFAVGVPIPEPSAYAALAGALTLGGLVALRRRRQV